MDVEVLEEPLEMRAHRSARDAEPVRDLLVLKAERDKAHDLRLARREALAPKRRRASQPLAHRRRR